MSNGTIAPYLLQRPVGYDILRRLFIEEPTPELLHFLQRQDLAELVPHIDDAAFTQAVSQVRGALDHPRFARGEAAFENLHWDFTRLFIGPETPPAPPWESVYVSRDKLLFQRCTNEVKRLYRRHGFMMSDDEAEAADHIGFELDFLYRQSVALAEMALNGAPPEQLIQSLQEQLDFLQQHPLAFAAPFCRNIQTHAQTTFYRGVGRLLPLFLAYDEQRLGTLIGADSGRLQRLQTI
ncbi:TorD/DmsD family molecular chaperone [Brenneria tiliae]|uniref:Molecular chaperone TorD family protein n=1 Tax=Brenneria tiliae TaxID=2914984 RepID=A0ABT0N1J6_9GAMM|nr:molecular chaperone TorD family protein [Brenneria tiliae]MCL2895672.1 molecular chaperone TorD family protein [Brenneria tiliae]